LLVFLRRRRRHHRAALHDVTVVTLSTRLWNSATLRAAPRPLLRPRRARQAASPPVAIRYERRRAERDRYPQRRAYHSVVRRRRLAGSWPATCDRKNNC
jgi:hypothetical protein